MRKFQDTLGFENGTFYVNSAQSIARSAISYVVLPDGKSLSARNAVMDGQELRQKLGDDAVVGRASMCEWLMRELQCSKRTAQGLSRKWQEDGDIGALCIDGDWGQPGEQTMIPWARESHLRDLVAQHRANPHTRAGRKPAPKVIAGTILPE